MYLCTAIEKQTIVWESNDSPCACGVIGSRARLRIWCREACRFESYQAHRTDDSVLKKLITESSVFFLYCFFYCISFKWTSGYSSEYFRNQHISNVCQHRFGNLYSADYLCFVDINPPKTFDSWKSHRYILLYGGFRYFHLYFLYLFIYIFSFF